MTAPADWPRDPDGVAYPPEPWSLHGVLLLSVFAVPPARLPDAATAQVPPQRTPLTVAGRAVVGAAFIRYLEGGVLRYDELLVALAVRSRRRHRWRPEVSIPLIWVTSEASRVGGRQLWAIPKGRLTVTGSPGPPTAVALAADGRAVAELTAEPGRRVVPTRVRLPLVTAQWDGGRWVVAANRITARPRTLRARWDFAPEGPLGFLTGRAPLGSLALTDADIRFGIRVERGPVSPAAGPTAGGSAGPRGTAPPAG